MSHDLRQSSHVADAPNGTFGDDGMLLRKYWYALLKHRLPVGAAVAVIVGVAVVVTFFQTSLYRATALVQVEQGRVNLASDATRTEAGPTYEEFFTTQQGILASRSLSRRVIEELAIQQHPLFDEIDRSASERERVLVAQSELLLKMLRIAPRRNTQLLELSYITPDPELSAALANTLALEYIAYSAESEAGFARSTSAFIREQIEKLQAEIAEKEKTLQEHSEREDVLLTSERDSVLVQRYESLSRELTAAQAARVEAEARLLSLSSATSDSIPEVVASPTVRDLKEEHADLQRSLAALTSRFGPSYPEVVRAREALADVEARIRRAIEEVAMTAIADAKTSSNRARSRELLLEKALEEQRQRSVEVNQLTTDYRRAQMELDNQRRVLEQLLRQQSATGLSADLGERESLMTVRLVDEAVVPTKRYSPRLALNVGVGLSLGALVAIALVFVLHNVNSTLQDTDDVRAYTSLPVLGIIPRTADTGAVPGLGRAIVGEQDAKGSRGSTRWSPATLLEERFKFVRSTVLPSNGSDAPETVLVTSANRDEGKTFVACGLARSFAALDKKVLLVDTDLRRPSLHRVLEMENEAGMTNVLADGRDLLDVVVATSVPNLSVLLAGPPTPSPAELLSSPESEAFLRRAKQAFDVVVVDSCPLLPVVDTLALVHRCDAVVMVVRSGQTTHQSATLGKELIEHTNGRIVGAILNDVDLDDTAYRYYYGSTDYGYGEDPPDSSRHE